jgi:hypothetical protein
MSIKGGTPQVNFGGGSSGPICVICTNKNKKKI